MVEHVSLCELSASLTPPFCSCNFPFSNSDLISSCPSPPSPPLTFSSELSHTVLFLLLFLGGSWSPCGAPAVSVNQHQLIASCDKMQWTKSKVWERERKRERLVLHLLLGLFLLCIRWLFSDWTTTTTTVPGDTSRSHTFHPWDVLTNTYVWSPLYSVTDSCCPITLKTKK